MYTFSYVDIIQFLPGEYAHISETANQKLLSHKRLCEVLFVPLEKCTRIFYSFKKKLVSFGMCFDMSLLTTNMED